jgi:hypothetical protein
MGVVMIVSMSVTGVLTVVVIMAVFVVATHVAVRVIVIAGMA